MLNGKFYTGLTANQLNRSRGPDRQRSSFFWPDETDLIPPSPKKNIRQNRNSVEKSTPEQSRLSQERDDVKPKELFHKQLTSNIEFNDSEVDASPKQNNRSSAKNQQQSYRQNTSQNNESFSKPDTFTSKIEFYDYVDGAPAKPATTSTPIRNRNTDGNLKTSPKNISENKKITFDDKYMKKGILKNNESPRTTPERNIEHLSNYKKNTIVQRQNLSKSVENISKIDLNNSGSDYNTKISEQTNKMNSSRDSKPSVSRVIEKHHEENYYTENSESPKVVTHQQRTVRNDYGYQEKNGINSSYNAHEETFNDYNNQYERRSVQRQSFNNKSQHHNISRDFNDNRNNSRQHQQDYFQDQQPYSTSNSSPQKLYRDSDKIKYVPIINKNSPSKGNYSSPTNKYDDVREMDKRRSSATKYGNNDREGSPAHRYPNEAAVRAHTHLRSNIFFNDDKQYNDERPRSIRESAVTRVGVGLPNI